MNFNKNKSMSKREQNNLHVHSKHNNAMQCNAMQCKQSKHESNKTSKRTRDSLQDAFNAN